MNWFTVLLRPLLLTVFDCRDWLSATTQNVGFKSRFIHVRLNLQYFQIVTHPLCDADSSIVHRAMSTTTCTRS
jgi:hypothetical protein